MTDRAVTHSSETNRLGGTLAKRFFLQLNSTFPKPGGLLESKERMLSV